MANWQEQATLLILRGDCYNRRHHSDVSVHPRRALADVRVPPRLGWQLDLGPLYIAVAFQNDAGGRLVSIVNYAPNQSQYRLWLPLRRTWRSPMAVSKISSAMFATTATAMTCSRVDSTLICRRDRPLCSA